MSIFNISSDISLNLDANIYFIDASSDNITITINNITEDYEFYNLIRIDNTSNVVNINLSDCFLITGEGNFNLHPLTNVTLMSNNNNWYPVAGYTANR